jgi:hypothetical protein
MIRTSIATVLKSCAVAFLLVVFLFADVAGSLSMGFIGSITRGVAGILRYPETQWMVFLCLGVYFITFLFLRSRTTPGFWRVNNPSLWLATLLLISAIFYALNYSPSIDALMLLAGTALGQGMAVWAGFEIKNSKLKIQNGFNVIVVSLLVVLLASASVWKTNASRIFEYRGYLRWCGPWDNPNIAGLLMGVGISLAFGLGVGKWRMEDGKTKGGVGKYAVVILCFFAATLMVRGLLHSYSRGAWLATCCGVAYLLWQCVNREIHQTHESKRPHPAFGHLLPPASTARQCSESDGSRQVFSRGSSISRLQRNWLPLSAILLSVVVLSFWQFRHTEHKLARRTFSVSNANDFSWRNRIAAWEGTLQMMAEKPWFGFGWNQPEPLYENDYSSPKLEESMAIQQNDYFMLGSSLGLPALFCFGAYIWLSLSQNSGFRIQKPEAGDRQDACPTLDTGHGILDWSQTICRAGAIVLLVGFWFDGGLFKLPTAATFWILLELGAAPARNGDGV